MVRTKWTSPFVVLLPVSLPDLIPKAWYKVCFFSVSQFLLPVPGFPSRLFTFDTSFVMLIPTSLLYWRSVILLKSSGTNYIATLISKGIFYTFPVCSSCCITELIWGRYRIVEASPAWNYQRNCKQWFSNYIFKNVFRPVTILTREDTCQTTLY